jgi:hypothetical protein
MKSNVRFALWGALAMALPLFFGLGCATSGPATQGSATQTSAPAAQAQAAPANVSGVEVQRPRPVIVDWMNSNVAGIPDTPDWLAPLVQGNSQGLRSVYDIPQGDVVKYSVATNTNRENARVQAGLLFAAKTANELKQLVVTSAAQTLDQGQVDIVEEITTATKVNTSGLGVVCDFWQFVENTDPTNNMKTRTYVYYIVYRCPQNTWNQLVAKYLLDVVGQLPDRRSQENMAGALQEVTQKSVTEERRTQAQFQQDLDLRAQAAKDAQTREMATINQRTVQSQNAADLAKVQAQEDSKARWAAYRSGDATTAAVASTTAGDAPWLDALKVAAGVLF